MLTRIILASFYATLLFACFSLLVLAGKPQPLFSEKTYLRLEQKYGKSVAERLVAWQALVEDNRAESCHD